ncbi:EAL domain-containing protein [Acetobacterium sp.]|uniref:EAL domain-containing protein n=1 Tax=Acetobacterium sp. TaxID=1872094 RepID=UPI00359445E3
MTNKEPSQKRNWKKSAKTVFIASLFIFISMLLEPALFVQAEDEKTVLFISSYSESFVSVPDQIAGIKSVFKEQRIKLEIEYMDTKRLDTPENKQVFYESLKFKLANLPPYDAVIVGDDNALQFAMDHQDELFPQIPIVFLGVNDEIRATQAAKDPYITGNIEKISIKETLEIAQVFNPKATRVVGIADETLTGMGNRQQFETLLQDFPELTFITINTPDYTFAELGAEVKKLGDESILLFLDMNPDKNGEYMEFEKAAAFLNQHTQIPVYRASVGGVGDGLIGGKMVDYEAMGKTAAELVSDIFEGTPVETIPLIIETPYYYIFDYALIQKYQIPDQLIPSDAVLINKVENPLDKYRNVILATAIMLSFLTLLTLILIYDNMKRRSMQKALEASNTELKLTYDELEAVEGSLRRQYSVMEEHDREVGELNQKFELAIEETNSAVWEVDLISKKIYFAGDFSRIINKTVSNGLNVYGWMKIVMEASHRRQLLAEVRNYLAGKSNQINIQVLTSGEEHHQKWLLIRGKGMKSETGYYNKLHGILLDNTKFKNQEEQIRYLARHDFLTQLPNRMSFLNQFEKELKAGRTGAVLLLDVDNFKSVNDTLGHLHGDELLKQIAGRLMDMSDDNMMVGRLGGDEFLILITNKCHQADIETYANKILSAFNEAFILDSREVFVSISMGISCYPYDSSAIDQLIMNADTAMYEVKNRGKNHYMYYHHELKNEMKRKIEIEAILRSALKSDGFKLVYQPQVDLSTGLIIGFEALLRLKEHSLGPDKFIPVAEETGLISEIGRWVAREAVEQIIRWRNKGLTEKPVAINFSNRQLRDKEYITHITTLLSKHKLDPQFIEIEITESILMENDCKTDQFLKAIREAGLSLALDDFGTGYSSLNCLTYLPVNKIKLDKSISDLFLQGNRIAVIESLILLAHSLNLKIMAEGIEAWENYRILKNSECDAIQGYVFSRPLDPDEIETIYNQNLIKKQQDLNA